MKRRPYTPREVEQCRIVAKDYPKGIRETILRLVDTIEEKERELEQQQQQQQQRPRRAAWLL